MRLVLLLTLLASCGRDAVGDRLDALCDGCTLDVPSRKGPVPLLVVLHGNHETAADAAKRWRSAALARGWAVLALQCPRAQGCDDEARWYKWGGAPSWIFDQIAQARTRHAFDAKRMYLAGWSGGASYMGMMAPHWEHRFAAVVFHGGGQPPGDADACPRHLPAYFLVGNENPDHGAARRLRDYWQSCGQEVRWDLIDGAGHAEEAAALDTAKAMHILGWLESRHPTKPGLVSAR
jgi:poly(3-hydroxybutyrate) depolymerase